MEHVTEARGSDDYTVTLKNLNWKLTWNSHNYLFLVSRFYINYLIQPANRPIQGIACKRLHGNRAHQTDPWSKVQHEIGCYGRVAPFILYDFDLLILVSSVRWYIFIQETTSIHNECEKAGFLSTVLCWLKCIIYGNPWGQVLSSLLWQFQTPDCNWHGVISTGYQSAVFIQSLESKNPCKVLLFWSGDFGIYIYIMIG